MIPEALTPCCSCGRSEQKRAKRGRSALGPGVHSRTKLAFLLVCQKRVKSVQKRGRSAFGPGMRSRTKLAFLLVCQKRVQSVQMRVQSVQMRVGSAFGPEIDTGQNTLQEEVI